MDICPNCESYNTSVTEEDAIHSGKAYMFFHCYDCSHDWKDIQRND